MDQEQLLSLQWTHKHSVNPDVRRQQEEALYDRFAERLIDVVGQQPEKYGIERLKALGATKFSGTTRPEEVKKWLRTIEKCFRVKKNRLGCVSTSRRG